MFEVPDGEDNPREAHAERPLFRKEVLVAREDSSFGAIRLAYPISQTIWAITAVLMAIVLVTWMYLGEYTRRLRVHGAFVPSTGVISLKARSAGEILKVHVQIGDNVHAGEPILLLGTEKATRDVSEVGDVVANSLEREAATLRTDLQIETQAALQQTEALHREIAALKKQMTRAHEELDIYSSESKRQQELLEKTRILSQQGFVTGMQVQTQETQTSRAFADVARQQSQIAALQRELDNAENRLAQAPKQAQARINDINRQLARTEASITRTELEQNVLIQAPADGEVSLLNVYPGQSLTVGQTIGAILPKNSKLFAELLVPSAAIGFVDIGSTIAMRYKAFPYQKFGVHWGKVVSISRTPVGTSDADTGSGLTSTESLYRIRVSLPRQSIVAEGNERPLLPGMSLEADIMLERRRIIDWIFEPIYSLQAGLEDKQ